MNLTLNLCVNGQDCFLTFCAFCCFGYGLGMDMTMGQMRHRMQVHNRTDLENQAILLSRRVYQSPCIASTVHTRSRKSVDIILTFLLACRRPTRAPSGVVSPSPSLNHQPWRTPARHLKRFKASEFQIPARWQTVHRHLQIGHAGADQIRSQKETRETCRYDN